MIAYKVLSLDSFEISILTLGAGDVFNTKLINPLPEQHLNENSMVVSGAITIQIDDYTHAAGAGENAKFTPRAGQAPFVVGTIVCMTAVEPTTYVCIKNTVGGVLGFESVESPGTMTPVVGSVLIPTAAYTLNGEAKSAGAPMLAKQGDVLGTVVGSKIGVFTPT